MNPIQKFVQERRRNRWRTLMDAALRSDELKDYVVARVAASRTGDTWCIRQTKDWRAYYMVRTALGAQNPDTAKRWAKLIVEPTIRDAADFSISLYEAFHDEDGER